MEHVDTDYELLDGITWNIMLTSQNIILDDERLCNKILRKLDRIGIAANLKYLCTRNSRIFNFDGTSENLELVGHMKIPNGLPGKLNINIVDARSVYRSNNINSIMQICKQVTATFERHLNGIPRGLYLVNVHYICNGLRSGETYANQTKQIRINLRSSGSSAIDIEI